MLYPHTDHTYHAHDHIVEDTVKDISDNTQVVIFPWLCVTLVVTETRITLLFAENFKMNHMESHGDCDTRFP